jgi:hypothetical protein
MNVSIKKVLNPSLRKAVESFHTKALTFKDPHLETLFEEITRETDDKQIDSFTQEVLNDMIIYGSIPSFVIGNIRLAQQAREQVERTIMFEIIRRHYIQLKGILERES